MGAAAAGSAGPGNIVCDLDGVVYVGDEPIPGAGAALECLRRSGYRVVLATNNSTRTPEAVAARIASLTGFDPEPASIVTSSIAVAALLSPSDSPALIIGEEGVEQALAEAGVGVTTDPEAARVVVVGLTRHFDYGALRDAARAVRTGARFIATNTDATFPTPNGPVPGAGAIVAAVATAAETTPEVAGKPHAAMLSAISTRLGPGPTWGVGDRAETDLGLAVSAGWRSVLVLSGITRSISEVPAHLRPDIVLETLGDLPDVLASRDAQYGRR